MIADIKRRDSAIEQLTRALEERDRIITEMMMENDSLKRHLKIYENPTLRRRTAACLRNKEKRVLQKGPAHLATRMPQKGIMEWPAAFKHHMDWASGRDHYPC